MIFSLFNDDRFRWETVKEGGHATFFLENDARSRYALCATKNIKPRTENNQSARVLLLASSQSEHTKCRILPTEFSFFVDFREQSHFTTERHPC